jgi:hypothetical protein
VETFADMNKCRSLVSAAFATPEDVPSLFDRLRAERVIP